MQKNVVNLMKKNCRNNKVYNNLFLSSNIRIHLFISSNSRLNVLDTLNPPIIISLYISRSIDPSKEAGHLRFLKDVRIKIFKVANHKIIKLILRKNIVIIISYDAIFLILK